MKKQIANIITCSRILGAICLLFCPVFSVAFYTIYLFCGITDMVDGTVARKTNAASEFGSKLDTIADIIFIAVCFAKILPIMQFPIWVWIWIAVIAIIKIGNIFCGFIWYKDFIALHSVLNKAVGSLLFLFPFTLNFIEITYSSAVVCFMATLVAVYETIILRSDRATFHH